MSNLYIVGPESKTHAVCTHAVEHGRPRKRHSVLKRVSARQVLTPLVAASHRRAALHAHTAQDGQQQAHARRSRLRHDVRCLKRTSRRKVPEKLLCPINRHCNCHAPQNCIRIDPLECPHKGWWRPDAFPLECPKGRTLHLRGGERSRRRKSFLCVDGYTAKRVGYAAPVDAVGGEDGRGRCVPPIRPVAGAVSLAP